MEPVRMGASLPPLPEAEPAATPALRPSDSVASAPSATATGNEANVFQTDVSDEVLVGFEHADPSAPFVVGDLWNAEAPPTGASSPPQSKSDRFSAERARLLEHQLKNLK